MDTVSLGVYPTEADLRAALSEDLQRITAKYIAMLSETYVGAAVCLSNYETGTLTAFSQDESQPLDAAVAMAMSLLNATLSD